RRAQRVHPGAAVPGTDQGSPEQSRAGVGDRRHRASSARALAEPQHQRGRVDRRAHHSRRPRARGEPRRAGRGLAQERHLHAPEPAWQAERLHQRERRDERAVHRRGRLGRRLRQAGARPRAPGDPAAARQGAEHRERVAREGAREQGAVGSGDRDRLRPRHQLRHHEAALRQADHPRRRRLRRQSHRHAAPHVHLPPSAEADSGRQGLPRPAAALPHRHRQGHALGARRCPQGRDPETGGPERESRDAGDHALQGPGRDDAEGAVGDDPEPAHAAAAARRGDRSDRHRSRDQRADGQGCVRPLPLHHGTSRRGRGTGRLSTALQIPPPIVLDPRTLGAIGAAIVCGLLLLQYAHRRTPFILAWAVGWLMLAPAFLVMTAVPRSPRLTAGAIGVSQLLRICSALLFVWSAELYRQSSYLRARWLKPLAAVAVWFIVAPLLFGAWTVVVPGYLIGATLMLATAAMYAAVVVERRMIGAGLTALVMLGLAITDLTSAVALPRLLAENLAASQLFMVDVMLVVLAVVSIHLLVFDGMSYRLRIATSSLQ